MTPRVLIKKGVLVLTLGKFAVERRGGLVVELASGRGRAAEGCRQGEEGVGWAERE